MGHIATAFRKTVSRNEPCKVLLSFYPADSQTVMKLCCKLSENALKIG